MGYLKLILLLLIPFLLLLAYSFSGKEFVVCGVPIEKADFGDEGGNQVAEENLMADTVAVVDTLQIMGDSPAEERSLDTVPQRILFFGDSMVEGLSKRMCQYAKENGHELLNIIWYSSSTELWAKSDTLAYFMHKHHPTYVMISIGGNELFVRDLDKREKYIRTIIEKVGDIPYIWIGPPNWKKDTGINSLLEKNVGSERFFLSKDLSFQRASDHIHPTFASAAVWMDSIASWMMSKNCDHPIKMKYPQTGEKKGKSVMLAPLK